MNKGFKFGLNINNKSKGPLKKSLSSFGQDEEEGTGETERERVNNELKAINQFKKPTPAPVAVEEEDATAYLYDEVYDQISQKKAQALQKKRMDMVGEDGTKKARYIPNIIKASSERNKYLESAAERKIQKERQEEQDQFGDKDKFVTEAYLKLKQEIKQRDIEEAKREALEQNALKKGDMTGFYKNILTLTDRPELGPIKLTPVTTTTSSSSPTSQTPVTHNPSVHLNDSGEVIDKRQLLTGGLNVSNTKIQQLAAERAARETAAREFEAAQKAARDAREAEFQKRRNAKLQAQRARAEIEQQKKERDIRNQERKREELQEFAGKMRKNNTDESISDARARYLERKKKMQEQEVDSDSD